MGELASIFIVACLLIIAGVAITPIYNPIGNASFWLGVILFALGSVVMFLRSE